MRLMKKVNDKFEKHLDVRSFIRVSTNLELLTSLLLSAEQRFLFKY